MRMSEWIIAPVVTVIIMAIAFVMSIVFQTTNRIIINHFIGWNNYLAMRKEMSEFQKESMAAARSNDKKQLEKVKKKQAQITAMNAQLMKPQMIQFGISFCYFPIWYFLRPIFDMATVAGVPGVVIIPGIGPQGFFIWYMLLSFFCGTLFIRLFGAMPID